MRASLHIKFNKQLHQVSSAINTIFSNQLFIEVNLDNDNGDFIKTTVIIRIVFPIFVTIDFQQCSIIEFFSGHYLYCHACNLKQRFNPKFAHSTTNRLHDRPFDSWQQPSHRFRRQQQQRTDAIRTTTSAALQWKDISSQDYNILYFPDMMKQMRY